MEITERMHTIILADINNLVILITFKEEQQALTTFGDIDPKEHLTLVNMAVGDVVEGVEALLSFFSSLCLNIPQKRVLP
jgi:hypothetical protein